MSVEELPTDKMKLCDLINNLIIKVNTHDEKFNTLNTKIDENSNTLNTLNTKIDELQTLMARVLESITNKPEKKSRKTRCINWIEKKVVLY